MKVVAKLRQRGEKDQPPKLLCYIKWLKNVVSFFLFCFENAKNLGRSDDAKRRKKRGMALLDVLVCSIAEYSVLLRPTGLIKIPCNS